MIRLTNKTKKNESTYIINHGFVLLLVNKSNVKDIFTVCTNDLEVNINNPNLNECNIRLHHKNILSDVITKASGTYDELFYIRIGELYSDVSLTDFIIRMKEGE